MVGTETISIVDVGANLRVGKDHDGSWRWLLRNSNGQWLFGEPLTDEMLDALFGIAGT